MRRVGSAKPVVTYPQVVVQSQSAFGGNWRVLSGLDSALELVAFCGFFYCDIVCINVGGDFSICNFELLIRLFP